MIVETVTSNLNLRDYDLKYLIIELMGEYFVILGFINNLSAMIGVKQKLAGQTIVIKIGPVIKDQSSLKSVYQTWCFLAA